MAWGDRPNAIQEAAEGGVPTRAWPVGTTLSNWRELMDASLAEQQRILASDWGGGKSPFGTSWSKFMMWIFIISDALTFAALLIAYGFMRMTSGGWPKQTEVFNMPLITFMT